MAFGRMMRKILSFLSPKELETGQRAGKKKEQWEPLTIKNASVKNEGKIENNEGDHAVSGGIKEQHIPGDTGRISGAYQYLRRNRKASAVVVAAIITLMFYRYVLPIYVILIFIAAASVSKLVQDWIPFVVGFDIVLFVTVISGAAYGWKAALVVGPVSSIIGSSLRRVTSQQFDTLIFPAIGYGVVAVLIPYFMSLANVTIFWLGLICTLLYVVIMNIVFAYFRPDIFNHMTFTVTSFLFNYWLFKNFAEPLIAILS